MPAVPWQDIPFEGVRYGYRVDGPEGWEQGHRFDKSKVLLDPYAKLVEGRRIFGDAAQKDAPFLGTYDLTSSQFDWGDGYKLPAIPEVNSQDPEPLGSIFSTSPLIQV